MQKLHAICFFMVSAVAALCGEGNCEGSPGRSLLQKAAVSSYDQNHGAVDDQDLGAEINDNKQESATTNVDLDVKIMEGEVANMQGKMKVIEDTLGFNAKSSGTSGAVAQEDAKKKTSLQQTGNEPSDSLQVRMSSLEVNVADLLSRTKAVEAEVGLPAVSSASLLDVTSDPTMGLANRAIGAYLKVHDLQGRITEMEHTVINSLKPDATLLKTEVDVLEGKMKTLKSTVHGPAAALLGIGSSAVGLKSQVSNLETRVGELMSTTAMLESEVNGPGKREEALLQKEEIHGRNGFVPGPIGMSNRVLGLHANVHDLKGRIAKLEHTVLQGLSPDAALLTSEVEVLEGKVKTLKSSVLGPASSLLGINSSEVGLMSQVSDLETRVGELLSTTATLETEVHGPPGEALFQTDGTKQGLVPRVSELKKKVSNLKSRVFTLEHHVTGL